MFEKILLICSITLISLNSIAQDFKAGAIAGATFAQVDGDTYGGFNKIGIVGGLYVSRLITEHWAGQLEIVYKQKGSRHIPDYERDNYALYKLNLDYLEAPLLAKYEINNFLLEAGVAMGTLINSLEEDQNGSVNSTIPFRNFELSSIAGVSYPVYKNILLNLRWSYGITRARKASAGVFDIQMPQYWLHGKLGQYNNTVSFSVCYEFERMFGN